MKNEFNVASVAEVPELVMLVNSAYRGEISRQGWTTEANILEGQRVDEEALRKEILKKDSYILFSKEREKINACVHLEKKNSQTAYLGMLTVDPRIQTQGLGKRLLNYAEDFVVKKWAVSFMEMTVISLREELIAWYIRRGYQLTAERRAFPVDDPSFGIALRKDLEFSVLQKRL